MHKTSEYIFWFTLVNISSKLNATVVLAFRITSTVLQVITGIGPSYKQVKVRTQKQRRRSSDNHNAWQRRSERIIAKPHNRPKGPYFKIWVRSQFRTSDYHLTHALIVQGVTMLEDLARTISTGLRILGVEVTVQDTKFGVSTLRYNTEP